jgi:hypothetical protein
MPKVSLRPRRRLYIPANGMTVLENSDHRSRVELCDALRRRLDQSKFRILQSLAQVVVEFDNPAQETFLWLVISGIDTLVVQEMSRDF